eukprot:Gb_28748 [translate_table: standard]
MLLVNFCTLGAVRKVKKDLGNIHVPRGILRWDEGMTSTTRTRKCLLELGDKFELRNHSLNIFTSLVEPGSEGQTLISKDMGGVVLGGLDDAILCEEAIPRRKILTRQVTRGKVRKPRAYQEMLSSLIHFYQPSAKTRRQQLLLCKGCNPVPSLPKTRLPNIWLWTYSKSTNEYQVAYLTLRGLQIMELQKLVNRDVEVLLL